MPENTDTVKSTPDHVSGEVVQALRDLSALRKRWEAAKLRLMAMYGK